MTDLKKTITKVVIDQANAMVSKKSRGTKIATLKRDIPIILIKPFSK